MKRLEVLLALFAIIAAVRADCYLHNPRGSNNRNCETNQNRNNDNRLFDSQNNGQGGYPCPRDHYTTGIQTPTFYYLQGSTLEIQWTTQHSCANGNNDCQVILQFACNDTLQSNARDGVPQSPTDSATNTVTASTYDNPGYGVHESLEYFTKCNTRYRNSGLYISDQALQNPGALQSNSPATATRQNPNQNTYGFECPEERDYYPYWHPTPWRDIAIFTTQPGNCSYYQAESQNVKPKGECFDAATGQIPQPYNNPQDCLANAGTWTVQPAWGIPPPQCFDASIIMAGDNSLGNIYNGHLANYNWTIPTWIENEACVLRIRYNITTSDTPWYLDSTSNGARALIGQNPFQDWGHGWPLQIPFNTDQGGRTFQDRSYIFAIRPRPPGVPANANIYNINVRGKRGNIVQVYPALEYDFVPNYIQVYGSDYVHFQWIGSDYNVARDPNDANGGPQFIDNNGNNGARSDRSNVVQLDYQALSVPRRAQYNTLFMNDQGQADMNTIYRFALIGQPVNITGPSAATKGCLNLTQLAIKNDVTGTYNILNSQSIKYDPQNCAALNAASVYFDGQPMQLKASGTFYYFCTRNNAFSNRSQKGTIVVTGGIFAGANAIAPSTAVIIFATILVTFIANLF
jgi:hypothetical protein